jgi:hypothetical protein
MSVLSLMLLGNGCATSPEVTEVHACEPDIRVVERFVPLPGDLTDVQLNPPVPVSGSCHDLLEWTLACAAGTAKLNHQMRAIRELETEN